MPTLVLGNTAPIEPVKLDETTDAVERRPRPDIGNTITTFVLPEHLKLGQMLTLVSSVFASHHSDAAPAWVDSDDETVASAAGHEFGCPVGKPDSWTEGPTVHSVDEPVTEAPAVTDPPVEGTSE